MKPCWGNTLFIATIIILGVISMISACGQKGNLYLPEHQAEQQQE